MTECVAYIAKGLAEVKKARLSLSATSGASPDVLSPVAPDEAVCDGNSADDENSEPDLPNKDHKKTKRDVARIASQLESIQLDSSRDKAALQPSSEVSLMLLLQNSFQLLGSFRFEPHQERGGGQLVPSASYS